jgi:hypothetical protein
MVTYDYESIKGSMDERAKALYSDIISCYDLPKEIRQHKFFVNRSQEFVSSVGSLYFSIFSYTKISKHSSDIDISSNINELFDMILDQVNNLHKLLKDINENNIR